MIRISTNTIFDQGVFNMQRGQSALVKLQDQISTNRRVRTPADDPVAAARALEVEQSAGDHRAVHPQRRQCADGAGLERERADRGHDPDPGRRARWPSTPATGRSRRRI